MPTNSDLERVVAQALTCPSLTKEELRFLHSLHLKLLAGKIPPTDLDRERVRRTLAAHGLKILPRSE